MGDLRMKGSFDLGQVVGPAGPAGPQGPPGPQGPAGGAGWGSGYKLVSANSYDISVGDTVSGGIKSNTITVKRTITNSMLIPVLRRTGWLNVSGMEWMNNVAGDRRLKVEFLNTTAGTHSGLATIHVLEFVKVG